MFSHFLEEKKKAWQRLIEDLEIGYLDTDILGILVEFFLRPKSFTKSSCSGRIVVMDSNYPWSKEETAIIFKKHEPIDVNELASVLARSFRERLWLNLQGPIYHVYSSDIGEALEVLEIAREAGFKHSGILSIGAKGVVVELRTGIRLVTILADKEGYYYDEKALERLVRIANDMLRHAKERNKTLLEILRRNRSSELWIPDPCPSFIEKLLSKPPNCRDYSYAKIRPAKG